MGLRGGKQERDKEGRKER
jgi:hypothetical protein